jgi:hypothetical protein
MFLVHFVADVHQPLHCAERNGDRGGNTVDVIFFGHPMTLHMVWNVGILDKRPMIEASMSDILRLSGFGRKTSHRWCRARPQIGQSNRIRRPWL